MELDAPKAKKNTGLLPQFENLLATSNNSLSSVVDPKKVHVDFVAIQKAVQRLFDQSPAITKPQFVRELADLLKTELKLEYLWVARVDHDNEYVEILAGCSKRKSGMSIPLSLFIDSPYKSVIYGERFSCARNALSAHTNNPYMIKFNIDGLIAHPLFLNGEQKGFLSVMNNMPIQQADEINQLFESISQEISEILFSES